VNYATEFLNFAKMFGKPRRLKNMMLVILNELAIVSNWSHI